MLGHTKFINKITLPYYFVHPSTYSGWTQLRGNRNNGSLRILNKYMNFAEKFFSVFRNYFSVLSDPN